jgi:hypothetical protein
LKTARSLVRWNAWRKRLGLVDTSGVSVLADGAKWIWEEQRRQLREAESVLDVHHAWSAAG